MNGNMLDILRSQPATPEVRCERFAVRACRRDEEGLAAAVLRRGSAWRAVGLAEPPALGWLDNPVPVSQPVAREVRIDAALVFEAPAHVVALLVAYGWDNNDDRVRVAEWVVVD